MVARELGRRALRGIRGPIQRPHWAWTTAEKQAIASRLAKASHNIPPMSLADVQHMRDTISHMQIVSTDGSRTGTRTTYVAGFGLYYGTQDPRNSSFRVPGDQCNVRGEQCGVLMALQRHREVPLCIVVDCTAAQLADLQQGSCNSDVTTLIRHELAARCFPTVLLKVTSHPEKKGEQRNTFHAGNDGADALANEGTTLPEIHFDLLFSRAPAPDNDPYPKPVHHWHAAHVGHPIASIHTAPPTRPIHHSPSDAYGIQITLPIKLHGKKAPKNFVFKPGTGVKITWRFHGAIEKYTWTGRVEHTDALRALVKYDDAPGHYSIPPASGVIIHDLTLSNPPIC
jgi:hypothetical protein